MGKNIGVWNLVVIDELNVFKAGSIVQRNKTNGPIITIGSNPPFDKNFANFF